MLLPELCPSGQHNLPWRRKKNYLCLYLTPYSPKTTKWYANKGYYYWWVFSDKKHYSTSHQTISSGYTNNLQHYTHIIYQVPRFQFLVFSFVWK
jgi:hypothetical protein